MESVQIARLVETALSRPIVAVSAKTALVVGVVLNVVNQGPALLHGDALSVWHATFNFLVPYGVSSYSAARHALASRAKPNE